MIEEKATVIRTGKSVAWVHPSRKSACGGCSLNKGCGVSMLERMLGNRRAVIQVIDPLTVQSGDEVVIGIEEQALVKGSVAVYLIPLLTMIISAIVGSAIVSHWFGGSTEVGSIVMGVLGFALGLIWLTRFSRIIGHNPRFQPVILRKTGQAPVSKHYIPIARI